MNNPLNIAPERGELITSAFIDIVSKVHGGVEELGIFKSLVNKVIELDLTTEESCLLSYKLGSLKGL